MNVHADSRRGAKGDRTRQAIMAAARRLFAHRGYGSVSVPQLGREAGVSPATLYLYFKGKKELLNAVFRDSKNRLMAEILRDLSQASSSRQRFAAVWDGIRRYVEREPEGLALLDQHHHSEVLSEENATFEDQSLQMFATLLAEGIEAGEIKPLAPATLMVIGWGTWVGLVKAARQGHLELTDEVIANAERACWDALAVHPGQAS